ncbi:MAG: hypothetical protein KC917_08285 [Candidatus Omnitrophica bacterium]|nr:hypothetical protein [Candidatus Omnitrophota bacterium]MCA9416254.1 hypothetical protein [Candidatus Omnitrophota bacterium]MCA9442639.1 hypothetical protein [Candidatus Omnitrophota bacterium]MCB9770566.1 hypothetical protein [Candidatus Omnitrophota bacterium]MCB9782610.1 hypothetical protein [Candidatus Omnitrophota bacterium]
MKASIAQGGFWVLVLFATGMFVSPVVAQSYLSPNRKVHGFSTTVYQSRWLADEDSDQDIYQYWNLEADEIVPGHARGAFSLRLNTDIDGRVSGAPGRTIGGPGSGTYVYDRDPFYSVDDARDREYVDLYTGYVDLYDGDPNQGFVRIGRQYLPEFDYIQADAIKLELPVNSWAKFKGYFGQAVSFYSGHDGDWTGGLGLEIQQSPTSKWWMEYHRYEDDISDDHSYSIETWQQPWEGASIHALYRGFDDQARDLQVSLAQYFSPWDLTLFLDYQRLFSELGDLSRQNSPLYRSGLLEQNPYNRYSIRFDKALPCNFGLSGGFSAKRVSNNDQDYGNHDYENGDITLSFYPSEKWYYSISGEWWNTDPESSFFGYSGEIGYSPNKCFDWTIGSSYGNYVFRYEDESQGVLYRESPFIKTYYTSLKMNVTDRSHVKVNFEIEDDDRDNDYYRLRLIWGQTF